MQLGVVLVEGCSFASDLVRALDPLLPQDIKRPQVIWFSQPVDKRVPILVQQWLNTRKDSVKVRFVHVRGELGPWLHDLDLIELLLILGILALNLLDHACQLSEFVGFELLTQCFDICLELRI